MGAINTSCGALNNSNSFAFLYKCDTMNFKQLCNSQRFQLTLDALCSIWQILSILGKKLEERYQERAKNALAFFKHSLSENRSFARNVINFVSDVTFQLRFYQKKLIRCSLQFCIKIVFHFFFQ